MKILEIQQVSKKFRIGERREGGYLSLRESLLGALEKPFQILKKKELQNDFWALQDISFDVEAGESIGIIGRNGAGKSTLLKILSKITPPSSGKIIGRGRVASLLEVGTGFHPELTGRENVFMNGSILGLRRSAIQLQFDAIVEFSGVEQFLDTQLKHFSSGMQLRLAFAVAAHLEPEILVIDEVLAVGDTEFQKKCIGKMNEVSRSGRTVLFVSHNLGAVAELCQRAILLEAGKIVSIGGVAETVAKYLQTASGAAVYERKNGQKQENETDPYYQKIHLTNSQGQLANTFFHNESIVVHLAAVVPDWSLVNEYWKIVLSLLDINKNRIFTVTQDFSLFFNPYKLHAAVVFPPNFIAPAQYSWYINITILDRVEFDKIFDCCDFHIVDSGSEYARYYERFSLGAVFPPKVVVS